jgi:hypothetical protein
MTDETAALRPAELATLVLTDDEIDFLHRLLKRRTLAPWVPEARRRRFRLAIRLALASAAAWSLVQSPFALVAMLAFVGFGQWAAGQTQVSQAYSLVEEEDLRALRSRLEPWPLAMLSQHALAGTPLTYGDLRDIVDAHRQRRAQAGRQALAVHQAEILSPAQ